MELEKTWVGKIEWLNAIMNTADSGVKVIDDYAALQTERDEEQE